MVDNHSGFIGIGDINLATNSKNISAANIIVANDWTTESGAYVCDVVYGTGTTPPTASNFPRGTLWVAYTP